MAKLDMVKDGHLGGYIRGGDPGTWCPHLWTWVVKQFGIRSVLDVGCGEGHSTRFFRELGCEVLGVDGCETAIRDSVIPGSAVLHDFCAGPFLTGRQIDLVWSCEFLEHVEARFVPNILRTFAQARKMILVTHAFPGQDDGHHHVNCRPSSYWIKQIESVGYHCDEVASRQSRTVTLRDYQGVNHFARSGLAFTRVPGGVAPATPASQPKSLFTGLGQLLKARYKAFAIHNGFRLSASYREHRRRRRAAKRAAGK